MHKPNYIFTFLFEILELGDLSFPSLLNVVLVKVQWRFSKSLNKLELFYPEYKYGLMTFAIFVNDGLCKIHVPITKHIGIFYVKWVNLDALLHTFSFLFSSFSWYEFNRLWWRSRNFNHIVSLNSFGLVGLYERFLGISTLIM